MPILKQQVDSAPRFVSLFSFMKDYTYILYTFSAQTVYALLKKKSIKIKIFEIF